MLIVGVRNANASLPVLLHASDVVGADRGACVHKMQPSAVAGRLTASRAVLMPANAKSDPRRSRRCSIDEGGHSRARSGAGPIRQPRNTARIALPSGIAQARSRRVPLVSGIGKEACLRRLRGRRRRDLVARSRGSRQRRGRVPSRRRAQKPSGACGRRCRPATRRRRAAPRRAGAHGARR